MAYGISPRIALTLPLLTSTAAAQTLVYELEGPPPPPLTTSFGAAVSGAGDVNGDGYDDFLIGDPEDDGFGEDAGSARVISGRQGQLIRLVSGVPFERLGEGLCGLGDVDGDGLDDYAISGIGASNDGRIHVYSGATGAELYVIHEPGQMLSWGLNIAAAEDVNGDGVTDLLVPGNYWGHPARSGDTWIYSGVDGSLLRRIAGFEDGVPGGWYRATIARSAGDIDGDGRADVAVTSGGTADETVVRVLSGASGATLFTFTGTHDAQVFRSAGGAGDWDGDGTDDFALLAWHPEPDSAKLLVHSGATGGLLQELSSFLPGEEVIDWANVGDADGDGLDDLALVSLHDRVWHDADWTVRVYAGGTGSPLHEFDRSIGGGLAHYWPQLAAAGDVNGDGLKDVIVGHHQETDDIEGHAPHRGRVLVFSPLRLELGVTGCFGIGCPCGNDSPHGDQAGCVNSTGMAARLTAYGIRAHLNDEIELHLEQTPPDAPVILLRAATGTGMGDNPFQSDGRFCLNKPLRAAVLIADGAGEAWIPYAYDWQYLEHAVFQCWYRDPAGPCGTGNNFSNRVLVYAE